MMNQRFESAPQSRRPKQSWHVSQLSEAWHRRQGRGQPQPPISLAKSAAGKQKLQPVALRHYLIRPGPKLPSRARWFAAGNSLRRQLTRNGRYILRTPRGNLRAAATAAYGACVPAVRHFSRPSQRGADARSDLSGWCVPEHGILAALVRGDRSKGRPGQGLYSRGW